MSSEDQPTISRHTEITIPSERTQTTTPELPPARLIIETSPHAETHTALLTELVAEVRAMRETIARSQQPKSLSDAPLTREQAAEYLGIHPDTLYRWAVEHGKIACSRLGDGRRAPIRFLKRDLDDFIARARIATVENIRCGVRSRM
jgi:excisionase family DNA binding protein